MILWNDDSKLIFFVFLDGRRKTKTPKFSCSLNFILLTPTTGRKA
jgi:hypothetical protein